jgi:hypothetical protein
MERGSLLTFLPLDSNQSCMNEVYVLRHYFFKIKFNIILRFMPKCPKWHLSLRFSD